MTGSRASLLIVLILFGGVLSAQPRSEKPIQVNIEAQELDRALNALAEQAGLQLLFRANRVPKDMRVGRLKGTYTAEQALARLLANTGLWYEYLDEKTVTILSAAESLAPASGNRMPLTGQLQLASASADGQPAHLADSGRTESRPSSQEVIVEGERIKGTPYEDGNMDLPRGIDDAKPYYIFSAEELDRSGANSVEEFLHLRLPMMTNNQIYSNLSASSVTGHVRGASQLDLRGMGTDQTLILVNGRPLPGVQGNVSAVAAQGDLNGIPMSAIDRIEVLPSSASGIYGGGAVGGVINVILKRNYAGFDTKLTYENTFKSDAMRRRVEGTAGFSLEGGRTQLMLTGSFYDGNSLLIQDRLKPIKAARDRVYANSPLYPLNVPPLGATPNIYTSAASLTLKGSGVSLNAKNTHLPAGFRGVTVDGTDALLANAGSFNLDYPDTPQTDAGLRAPIGSTPRHSSFVLSVRRQMTKQVEVFLEGGFTNNYVTDVIGRIFSTSVPATAPTNPFNEAVTIYTPDNLTHDDKFNRILTRRLSGGVSFELPHRWKLQVDHAWSETRSSYNNMGVDATLRTAAIADGSLNLFVDTLLYPIDWTPYLFFSRGDTKMGLNNSALRAFGPVFRMPAGEVQLAASVFHRKSWAPDVILVTTVPNRPAGDTIQVNPARSQNVTSAYLEATIPLFTPSHSRKGINTLDLQLALRHEAFEVHTVRTATGGATYTLTSAAPNPPELFHGEADYSSTNPTIGLRYRPVNGLMLRLSWATAFRPPSYSQLQPPVMGTNPVNVIDPRRGNTPTPIFTLSGGNPELEPESARNWTAGVVLTPPAWKGFRLSVDYTRIAKSNNIGTLGTQAIVDQEDEFPDRVVRGDVPPGDP